MANSHRPIQQVFPPPPPEDRGSNSSSSSRKRKSGDNLDTVSHASSNASSDFSTAVRRRVEIIDDATSCWHCGASPTDICHVIGKKDRMVGSHKHSLARSSAHVDNYFPDQFPEIVRQGLITFDHLGHIDNAVPLCPLCHRNFDNINNPGLIFLPFLPYFIDFEKSDFAQREKTARETRCIPSRICPTPQMYREHLRSTGQLSGDGDRGGLYWRYTLRNFFPNLGQDNNWNPGLGPFQQPESWHGAPMAAIWRAFLILGNPLCRLPDEQTELLQELRDLYKRTVNMDTSLPQTTAVRAQRFDSHYTDAERQTAPPFTQEASNEEGPGLTAGGPDSSDPLRSDHEAITDSGIDVVSQQFQPVEHANNGKKRPRLDSGYLESSRPRRRQRIESIWQSRHSDSSGPIKTTVDGAARLPKIRVRKDSSFLSDQRENAGHQTSEENDERVLAVQKWILDVVS